MPPLARKSLRFPDNHAALMHEAAQTRDIPKLAGQLEKPYVTFTERLTGDGYTVTLCGRLKGVAVSKTLSVHRCTKGHLEQRTWAHHNAEASARSIAGLLELPYEDAGEPAAEA